MVPENFIALLAQNNGAEARTVLEDGLSQIILNRLEERKRELAGGLFSGYATEPVQEEFEQLDEISAGTAKSVGDKRHTQGLKFYGMSERSTDPLVKKVFAGKAEKLNKKAHNAYGYSFPTNEYQFGTFK